jgi:hypothetical protein
MKKLLSLTCTFLFVLVLHAQEANLTFEVVNVTDVPEAVTMAQEANYPGIQVRQWKKQSLTVQTQIGAQYLAVFNSAGMNTRARYTATGKGLSAYTSIALSAVPDAVTASVDQNYADYQLTRLAKVTSLKSGKFVYRINLRDGAKKLTIILDKNGNELSKDSLPAEIEEEV